MSKEWASRAELPQHVVMMLNHFPVDLHPMSQFTAAIAALNKDSKFAAAYSQSVPKEDYWMVCKTSSCHIYLYSNRPFSRGC